VLESRVMPFIAPPRESSRWSVRNPNMSGSGPGHVRHTSLKTSLGTEYVWSRTSLLRNQVRSDMSGLGVGYVREMPLEPGLRGG
jgi:hypothetical protein